jgi:phosphoribosylaminoimidazole-succinocarboxamide synthase
MDQRRYRVGPFAKASGVSVRTLHHYDRLGLVKAAGRDDAGYRYYTQQELLTLQQVLTLRYLGLSLGAIAELIRAPSYDVEASLRAQRRVLEERHDEIASVTSSLDRMLRDFEATGEWDWQLVADASQALAGTEKTMDNAMTTLIDTPLPNRTHRGKVRDTHDLGDGRLLIVATDRISAFDVVLPNGIPDKGNVLTQMAAFWFELTREVVPNHFIRLADGTPADKLPFALPDELKGRSTIARKAQALPVECIARGYLTGSAWAEYKETGRVCGVPQPPGMVESEQFIEPIFTPTTKAETGHDLNMSIDEMIALIGEEAANAVRLRTLALYNYAWQYAWQRGIIIADTKFEFGLVDGEPIVIDEMLTPDSSRFWPADQYRTGRSQASFDKQYVRDWLLESGWNREPPPPELPPDVIEKTSERYREAFRRLTGEELARY